jgi:hypothetical protein
MAETEASARTVCLESDRGWAGENLECSALVSRLGPLGSGEQWNIAEEEYENVELGKPSPTGFKRPSHSPGQPFFPPAPTITVQNHGPGRGVPQPRPSEKHRATAPLSCALGPLGGRKQCIVRWPSGFPAVACELDRSL